MAFLTLTSDIQEPFVIPGLSPVSQPSTRKNSSASVTDLEVAMAFATANAASTGRKNSITLL
ncbi:hypothetical protein HG535_0B05230 [Zygotorulaspora mrakii]|uniref:Uncharacterized protein n=1 Tax=Zygotorulaspora mrakii TaxID=42260 RepID=A0A7H9AYU3_ZYGMR|nr:uncharacterized protein HG535_0B05230 [Zygotorulaspora mrakii]QLG71481.1 hypothetical protein HG535_0B05230 [Zygotorulaspora mrakii]